jgi:hypothetical protein
MPTCSAEELVRILIDVSGATFVTFTARTDAGVLAKDRTKKPNPHPRPIWKTAVINGMVNFWYDRGVLKRLKAEGKALDAFRSGSSWHLPVMVGNRLTPLCTAKGEKNRDYYLRVMCLAPVGAPQYHDADGRPLTEQDVAPYLRAPTDYANQGLDAPLVFKTYHLSGIRSLTMKGLTYVLTSANSQ